jgi:hypothetical protein
MHEISNARATL